jgi:hypothetical protein
MWRIMVGLAAWTAGTVIAVSVAWLGANVVVRNAGVGPGMPVIDAAVLPSPAAPASTPPPPVTVAPRASTAKTTPSHAPASATSLPASPPASQSASPAGRPAPSASASTIPSAGDVKAYTLTGGRVTLDMSGGTVQLVTAVPDAGYSVQTWSGTGWLRVDFSSGPQVSSLIASWYQHAPTITVTNPS